MLPGLEKRWHLVSSECVEPCDCPEPTIDPATVDQTTTTPCLGGECGICSWHAIDIVMELAWEADDGCTGDCNCVYPDAPPDDIDDTTFTACA